MKLRLFLLFVCASLTVACSSDAQDPVDRVDAETLLGHVEELSSDAYEGRKAGTAGGDKAIAYILDAFEGMELEPLVEGYKMPFQITSTAGEGLVEATNMIGVVRGSTTPDSFIVMTAHFDHLGVRGDEIFNGADDNASGTAGLIEAARYFNQNPARHSIIFAALDAEEGGLRGARAFVANPPVPADQIILNINLDMISNSKKNELYAAGTYHYPFLKPYLESVGEQAEITLSFGHDVPGTGSNDWTMSSDHGPFHQDWGLPFVYFGVEDHPDYHKPSDEFDTITPVFFEQAVELIVASVLELDANLGEIAVAGGRR